MSTKRARDIMIPLNDYPHIPYWFTLRQAVALMDKAVLACGPTPSLPRALLVIDEPYQLMGIVRRRDILAGLEPRFLRSTHVHHSRMLTGIDIDPNLGQLSIGQFTHAMKEQANVKVVKVMKPIHDLVDENEHLAVIIYKMINHDQNLLPVMSGNKVIGVVRSVDVFSEVAHVILDNED